MSGELSNLKAPEGSSHKRIRLGRGHASGKGKTSGRGMKGQKARKSGHTRIGFEGGQMPLHRRLPKRGFYNHFGKDFAEIHIFHLNQFEEGTLVDHDALRKVGLAKGRKWDGVKILSDGELTKKLSVKVHRISQAAREKIEKAGGTVELIPDREKWQREDARKARRAAKGAK